MANIAFNVVERLKDTKWRRVKEELERVNRKKIMTNTKTGIIKNIF